MSRGDWLDFIQYFPTS